VINYLYNNLEDEHNKNEEYTVDDIRAYDFMLCKFFLVKLKVHFRILLRILQMMIKI